MFLIHASPMKIYSYIFKNLTRIYWVMKFLKKMKCLKSFIFEIITLDKRFSIHSDTNVLNNIKLV